MKYFPLIWAGLWRKRVRTCLTALSIVVAFSLFGIMHGVTAGLDAAIEGLTQETRLMTQSRINIIEPLPIAVLPQMESIDGVEYVVPYGYFGGYYQEPRNQINTGAVYIDEFLEMYPEFVLPKDQLEAMMRTRTGAIVGRDLAERFEWKIGDRIPLGSTIWTQRDGSSTWELDVVGIWESRDEGLPADDVYFHYDYFDESRSFGRGTVAVFMTKIRDASRAVEIGQKIDALFANSPNETITQNERDFTRAQIAQIGDINFFVNAIVGAVLFTLLFLTGNTMMQSVRERIPELAVLKTYGYPDAAVSGLVVAESLILCGVAALAGLAIAAVAFPSVFRAMGVLAMPLPGVVVAAGLAIAALLALVSALPPAWRAQRLSIVDALAGR
ncbi:MAG TPA: ABC transporter permease [Gammaproteobacteria bacterium]